MTFLKTILGLIKPNLCLNIEPTTWSVDVEQFCSLTLSFFSQVKVVMPTLPSLWDFNDDPRGKGE